MTIQECYIQMKADYKDVLNRFGTDATIERFLLKFLNDSSFNNLLDAFEKNDIDAAFAAAHTLKGVSMNLGFTYLGEVSSKLTELLRDKCVEKNMSPLFFEVQEAYKNTIDAIKQYQNEKLGGYII